MVKLYNEPVIVGDKVYDLINGEGTVVETVEPSTVAVKFRSGKRIAFIDGSHNGIARLFWQNPVVVAPPKDKSFWQHFTQVIAHIYLLLRPGN